MNDLIQSLQDKLGLTSEQANGAVTHVVEYFKAKLPVSLQEHFDAATIKAKGSELLAEAEAKGGNLFDAAKEKLNSFLHSNEPSSKV